MSDAPDDVDRLVEVWCRPVGEPWNLGSGWLVGSGYVLTAAHNVRPSGEVEQLLIKCRDGAKYPVTVVVAGEPNTVDLAVLELTGEAAAAAAWSPVRFAGLDRGRAGAVIECWAVGFPDFKRKHTPEGRLREPRQVNGRLPVASNLSSGRLELLVDTGPPELASTDRSQWAGMSGAVVFAPGPGGVAAVGVVIEHHVPEGASSLTVEPIAKLAELAGEADNWWFRLKLAERVIMAGAPAARPAPAGRVELLARKPDFVGRVPEMNTMIAGLAGKLATHSPVVVLYGLGGAGKTELATQVAHELGEQFPRARIQVELGSPDEPVDEVAAEILLAFGLSERELPRSARARLRKLAELLEPGGCLLVLDNMVKPDQLKGLLPATPRNAAIVTSRIRLAIDAAMLVRVGPLPEGDGIALLREIRRQLSETFDEDDARRVVELVGGLPLAIRLAGAMQPGQPLSAVADRLADEGVRLSHLDYEDRLVGPVFDASYQDLPAELARCFQVIGLVRSRSFSYGLIAHAAGVGPVSAQLWLDQLVRRQLVEQVAADRYGLHELVWLHARQVASGDAVSPRTRRATQRRVVEWYANRISDLMSAPGAHERPPDEALAWFAFERVNLRPVLGVAREIGAWEPLHRIAESCYGLFFYPGRWAELAEVAELGAEAARELGDPDGEVGRLIHLAEALRYTGRAEQARARYERAVGLAREHHGAERLGWVLTHYGDFLCDVGHGEEAVHGPYAEAMTLQREVGGKCWVSAHIMDAYRGVRRFDKAIDEGRRSLERCTADGSGATEAEVIWCRWHLAIALYEDDQLDEAEGHLLVSVEFHRRTDDPGGLSTMLLILGKVYLARASGNDRARAGEVLREAKELAHRIGASAREREIDTELDRLDGRQHDTGYHDTDYTAS